MERGRQMAEDAGNDWQALEHNVTWVRCWWKRGVVYEFVRPLIRAN